MSYDLNDPKLVPFWSHPGKRYVDHIKRMLQGFNDVLFQEAVYYHDVIKLATPFQTYIRLERKEEESIEAFERRRMGYKTTHALESAYIYYVVNRREDAGFLMVFTAIANHHGALPDMAEMLQHIKTIPEKFNKSAIKEVTALLGLKEEESFFAFQHFFFHRLRKQLSDFTTLHNAIKFKELFSRLVLADRYEAVFDAPYKNLPYKGADEVRRDIKKIESYIANKKKSVLSSTAEYRERLRHTVFGRFNANSNVRFYVLKAPTGAGKTLLALELALRIAEKRSIRRIITALPFTSIIDQTADVYASVLSEKRVLKYHHLTRYKAETADEKEQLAPKIFAVDVWDAPFVVTTFNQLFYALFSNHNKDLLRLETLRESVVVLDEVQAIPRGLWRDLYKVLELYAKRYDITFILMSATMPRIERYLPQAIELSEPWFYTDKQGRYKLCYEPAINSLDALSKRIGEQEGLSVLCVVNTVEKAKHLFRILPGEIGKRKFLLTTHQIPKHRKEIIAEISERLKNGEPVVLVATQLIEAGVDLDFDTGFREFAPFASIVQTAGRINREGRRKSAELVVTAFLRVGEKKASTLPYDGIDLRVDEVGAILQETPNETDLLEKIEIYYEAVAARTNSTDLIRKLEQLNFATLWEYFNNNFMPSQPWKVSLVVETDGFSFDAYEKERDRLNKEVEDVFERRALLKELEKEVAEHTIQVAEDLIGSIEKRQQTLPYRYGRYILPKGSLQYSRYTGLGDDESEAWVWSDDDAFD